MSSRIPAQWWPVLVAAAPVLVPLALLDRWRLREGQRAALLRNDLRRRRITAPLDLPELERLELTVLVEHAHAPGFRGDPGVSYLLRSDRGALLMDLGFGPETESLEANAEALGLDPGELDALLITHLHFDHMGGQRAQRDGFIGLPGSFVDDLRGKPAYLPAPARSEVLDLCWLEGPALLEAGLASTGPLSRMFSVLGMIEEQALVGLVRGKGLVVVTGCGHPTIEAILERVGALSPAPLYAVCGGLHFPLTASRSTLHGLPIQRLAATGKPIWSALNDDDLSRTIEALNRSGVQRLLLSAHDTCDHAIDRLSREVRAPVEVLRAGGRYDL